MSPVSDCTLVKSSLSIAVWIAKTALLKAVKESESLYHLVELMLKYHFFPLTKVSSARVRLSARQPYTMELLYAHSWESIRPDI